jgi:hypothetical protein
MMKKTFLLLAVLTLTAATASAQMVRLGVKAGVSMLSTDVKHDWISFNESLLWNEFKSKDMGWQAGLMARVSVPLTGLYVQPELVYNHAAYQIFNAGGGSEKVNYGNLEMPVLLGFKILFLRANVGPTFTLANITGGDVYKIERPDVGYQAGVGATLGKVTLDLRYQGYFEKKWDDLDLSDVTRKLKANDGYWGVSVGCFF